MRWPITLSLLQLAALIRAQQLGDMTKEDSPKMTIQDCSKGACKPLDGVLTIDANWRWAYNKAKANCYKGNLWDPESCPDGNKCAQNCFLDGANYKDTYGIVPTAPNAVKLSFVTNGPYSKNIGSRVYFSVGDKYQMFHLKNNEFSFTVDLSELPCGLNGALYFAGMEEDGGTKKHNLTFPGPTRGLGYCDAQCPQDVKWIGGAANSVNWVPSKTDPNSGTGSLGSCCCEMDIWEANSVSQAFTPHPCTSNEPTICKDEKCANGDGDRYKGICDKDGCDFASYRWGATEFYGKSKKVDSSKKFTVVTQFITTDGTDKGDLKEIRRVYVQDGQVIKNEAVTLPGSQPADSITQDFCDATKAATKDINDFKNKGGMGAMDGCMSKGMVLVLSLWDDQMAHMNWLDSTYPPDKDEKTFGVKRGTCPVEAGNPDVVREKFASASVEFSDIKFGAIGSTFAGGDSGSTTAAVTSSAKGPRRKCRG